MKRVHRIGLVTAGKITGLWLEKTPELKRNVGPVYSTSLRLASRASNTLLRTGFHTTDWEELRRCEAVLLFLPPKSLRSMVGEWVESGYDLRGLRLVLCDEELGLADFEDLRKLGALTAALSPLPHYEVPRLVGDGDPIALAPVIRLLEADGLKVTRLHPGGKERVSMAVEQLHEAALPMFARAVDAFRESGLTQEIAVTLAEKGFSHMLRLYARNGRRVFDQRAEAATRDFERANRQDLLALEGALSREQVEKAAQAFGATAGGDGS